MSQTPYYISKYRTGVKMGHQQLIDGMIMDGLWDPHHQYLMGNAAELCAKTHSISRQEQDNYAILSYQRAIAAAKTGVLSEHAVAMTPKNVPSVDKNHHELQILDENLQRFDEVKLRGLKPVFQEQDGTVTAGNASGLSDGACALVLISGAKAHAYGIQPIAKIISFADAQQNSEHFITTPSIAIQKALDSAHLPIEAINVFEINEAFAVVVLANQKILQISTDKLNILGGSVALGHPLGW
jgi:acetyl-CoA C-acetyltransferase